MSKGAGSKGLTAGDCDLSFSRWEMGLPLDTSNKQELEKNNRQKEIGWTKRKGKLRARKIEGGAEIKKWGKKA